MDLPEGDEEDQQAPGLLAGMADRLAKAAGAVSKPTVTVLDTVTGNRAGIAPKLEPPAYRNTPLKELKRTAGPVACSLEAFRRTLAFLLPSSVSRQLWPADGELEQVRLSAHLLLLSISLAFSRANAAQDDPEEGAACERSDLLSMHARRGKDGREDVVLGVEAWSAQDMRVRGMPLHADAALVLMWLCVQIVTIVSYTTMLLAYALLIVLVVVKCALVPTPCSSADLQT